MVESTGGAVPKKEPTAEEMAREIKSLAVSGEFLKAEKMREHLLQRHPMALSEIVASAEIIDNEKGAQMDQGHIEIWNDLYSSLSQEEQNCLFYATRPAVVTEGKLLFAQGKPNKRLFFIDSGRITLYHKKGEERHFIGQLSVGDILGEDALLDITFATFAAGCQTDVKLRYLVDLSMEGWDKECPGLKEKLIDYCLKKGRTSTLLKKQGFDKRMYSRHPAEGRVIAHIINNQKERTNKGFKGFLQDFSRNGMSFDIRLSKRATAQALLGRLLELEIDGLNPPVYLVGRIVRLGFHLHGDYSVHVKLDRVLPENVLQAIIAS
ncbi:Crp/Fnr family transcriptional regulator [Desulfopila sp. IMCC35008]|uniref:Crp/Fnr family transcriptional regulator n=1 Tax=Desulfopila sp. IMCC35008 TaxID=2653858 RepID=UPI0013D57F0A|nr:cyclic nucleotide-binding domain-containing protein [Desulfopila sp. IMCC35008]